MLLILFSVSTPTLRVTSYHRHINEWRTLPLRAHASVRLFYRLYYAQRIATLYAADMPRLLMAFIVDIMRARVTGWRARLLLYALWREYRAARERLLLELALRARAAMLHAAAMISPCRHAFTTYVVVTARLLPCRRHFRRAAISPRFA